MCCDNLDCVFCMLRIHAQCLQLQITQNTAQRPLVCDVYISVYLTLFGSSFVRNFMIELMEVGAIPFMVWLMLY